MSQHLEVCSVIPGCTEVSSECEDEVVSRGACGSLAYHIVVAVVGIHLPWVRLSCPPHSLPCQYGRVWSTEGEVVQEPQRFQSFLRPPLSVSAHTPIQYGPPRT